MNTRRRLWFACRLLLTLLIMSLALPSVAGSFAASTVSFTKPALAMGLAACALSSKDKGIERANRASDAVMLSVGIARLMKSTFDISTSPNFHHSFPSGHTASAFAMATSLADAYPKKKWLCYAGAAVIGWSTVKNGDHAWGDVVGGAALGITVGKWSLKHKDGLLLGHIHRF